MSRRGWALFAVMAVVWGTPYLLIRVAVTELEPVVLVAVRAGLAALLLAPLAVRPGALRAVLRSWRPVLAYTVLEVTGPWLLLSHAEEELPSALTGLLVAAVPLVAAVATRLVGGDDRLTAGRALGLGVGLAGVAVLLGLDVRGAQVGAAVEVGLVALGYGTAPLVVSRSLRDVPPLAVITASLVITAVVYAPFAAASLPARWPSGQVVTSVVLLTVVCTAAAFVVFFALIAEVGPNRALVITFLNPVVALALGIALLDERFTPGMAIGFPLVLLGCWLATRRPAAPGDPAAPADPASREGSAAPAVDEAAPVAAAADDSPGAGPR
ncbi:DMT family transporter [Quadrisphaera sp. DSM 44207]|uniref:DMT family transporter n=1 Tax=Quadrisphaera sp. DSM 44207 TaxID=1881057 RepID=UPI0008800B95|nr:DMT family transporter [Quadrisphaera sp. DSM 44207]SDQ89604.1 Permease of the drug/metabolite transporter (DMT) superfamily [Quadrisphaera sp. DSM 44207]